MIKVLDTSIFVAGSPENVWRVLTTPSTWPRWNVADPEFIGEFQEGSTGILKPAAPNGKSMTVKIRLISVKDNRELAWTAGIPLLFRVYHSFTITPEGAGCRVGNYARFSGLLTPFILKSLPNHGMFEQTNKNLRGYSEM